MEAFFYHKRGNNRGKDKDRNKEKMMRIRLRTRTGKSDKAKRTDRRADRTGRRGGKECTGTLLRGAILNKT